ncbi:uncharacterized protein IWZ02DRAFT_67156 [Phyllosticta citriasiana]|uniref:Transmembrane protein n=1 Tax=Phyllosticta citriasiana TaxID=595635 RepID=A0ABR1K9C7_9PEZI
MAMCTWRDYPHLFFFNLKPRYVAGWVVVLVCLSFCLSLLCIRLTRTHAKRSEAQSFSTCWPRRRQMELVLFSVICLSLRLSVVFRVPIYMSTCPANSRSPFILLGFLALSCIFVPIGLVSALLFLSTYLFCVTLCGCFLLGFLLACLSLCVAVLSHALL